MPNYNLSQRRASLVGTCDVHRSHNSGSPCLGRVIRDSISHKRDTVEIELNVSYHTVRGCVSNVDRGTNNAPIICGLHRWSAGWTTAGGGTARAGGEFYAERATCIGSKPAQRIPNTLYASNAVDQQLLCSVDVVVAAAWRSWQSNVLYTFYSCMVCVAESRFFIVFVPHLFQSPSNFAFQALKCADLVAFCECFENLGSVLLFCLHKIIWQSSAYYNHIALKEKQIIYGILKYTFNVEVSHCLYT